MKKVNLVIIAVIISFTIGAFITFAILKIFNNINKKNLEGVVRTEAEIPRNEVHPRDIRNIYLNVYSHLGDIEGYVIFWDKNDKHCCTNGTLYIARKYVVSKRVLLQRRGVRFKRNGGDLPARYGLDYENGYENLKTIVFVPEDFEFLELRDGSIIFALRFRLKPDWIKPNDIIEVEWKGGNIRMEASDKI